MGAPLGNDNAAKGKEWRNAIRRALAHKHGSVQDGLLAIARQLVDKAEEGDMTAIRELGDREDGKPAQAIGGSDDLPPIAQNLTVHLVKAAQSE